MVKMRIVLASISIFCVLSAHAGVYQRIGGNGTAFFGDRSAASEHYLIKQAGSASSQFSRTDRLGYPKSIILELRGLLERGNFDELNRKLAGYQAAFESNINAEDDLFAAYDAFEINSKSDEALFDSWVKFTPSKYQSYLARAKYYSRMGWFSRGTKWASETKKEQFELMDAYFDKARRDIEKVLSMNNRTILPYYMLIDMGKARGGHARYSDSAAENDYQWLYELLGAAGVTAQVDEDEEALRSGLKISPGSYHLREKYLQAITPRWGGSFRKMQSFINSSMSYVSLNPRLKLLKGFVYAEAGEMQALDDKYSVAEKLYDKALVYGENPSTLLDRGKNSYRQKSYSKALRDINRAIELYSENGNYYYWRSLVYSKQKDYIKAAFDIKMANMLVPYDADINNQKGWVVSKLVYIGYTSSDRRSYKQALEYFNAALHVEPKNADAYYYRARALIGQNKRDMALGDLKMAINLKPGEFGYYQLIDWLLSKRARWDQIIQYWTRYIKLNPDDGRAYVERGGAYFHKGDMRSAVHNAKIAADLGDPDGKEAYEKYKDRVE